MKSSSKNTRHEITACSYFNKNCAHRSDTAQSCEHVQIKQRYSTVLCPVTAIQTRQNHPKKHTLDSITLVENNDASSLCLRLLFEQQVIGTKPEMTVPGMAEEFLGRKSNSSKPKLYRSPCHYFMPWRK